MTLAALFGLLVAGTTRAHPGLPEVAFRVAVAVGGGAWLHRRTTRWLAGRLDRRRSPGGMFVVSPFGIEVADARIEREHLERLVVRNMYRAEPARAGGATTKSHAAAAVSYVLCAESEGRTTVLAGGMTESTALGLLTDVSRILSVGMAAARERVGVAAGSR